MSLPSVRGESRRWASAGAVRRERGETSREGLSSIRPAAVNSKAKVARPSRNYRPNEFTSPRKSTSSGLSLTDTDTRGAGTLYLVHMYTLIQLATRRLSSARSLTRGYPIYRARMQQRLRGGGRGEAHLKNYCDAQLRGRPSSPSEKGPVRVTTDNLCRSKNRPLHSSAFFCRYISSPLFHVRR